MRQRSEHHCRVDLMASSGRWQRPQTRFDRKVARVAERPSVNFFRLASLMPGPTSFYSRNGGHSARLNPLPASFGIEPRLLAGIDERPTFIDAGIQPPLTGVRIDVNPALAVRRQRPALAGVRSDDADRDHADHKQDDEPCRRTDRSRRRGRSAGDGRAPVDRLLHHAVVAAGGVVRNRASDRLYELAQFSPSSPLFLTGRLSAIDRTALSHVSAGFSTR
jgi:hypothetical protein